MLDTASALLRFEASHAAETRARVSQAAVGDRVSLGFSVFAIRSAARLSR